MRDYETIIRIIQNYIDSHASEITAFSDYLAANPELPGEEYNTSKLMVEKLRQNGFDIEYPFCGISTAYLAKKSQGSNKPVVAIMVEYDALPVIGHACGHNLHGTMAMYAGIALGQTINDWCGELRVIGTPAEEADGGQERGH